MFSYNFVQALVTCKFNKFNDIQFHDVANSIWKGSSNRMDGWFSRASKSGTKCQRVTYPNPCNCLCLHSRDSFMIRISVCDVSFFVSMFNSFAVKDSFFSSEITSCATSSGCWSTPTTRPATLAITCRIAHEARRQRSSKIQKLHLIRFHQGMMHFAFIAFLCEVLALHHNFWVAWPSLCHQRAIQPDLVPNLKKITSR